MWLEMRAVIWGLKTRRGGVAQCLEEWRGIARAVLNNRASCGACICVDMYSGVLYSLGEHKQQAKHTLILVHSRDSTCTTPIHFAKSLIN